jgi:hypothetical protein
MTQNSPEPKIQDGLKLDLNRLARKGFIKHGANIGVAPGGRIRRRARAGRGAEARRGRQEGCSRREHPCHHRRARPHAQSGSRSAVNPRRRGGRAWHGFRRIAFGLFAAEWCACVLIYQDAKAGRRFGKSTGVNLGCRRRATNEIELLCRVAKKGTAPR